MRILLASSEVHPYSKSGGLADSVGALARALAQDGNQVGVVSPLYRGVKERHPRIRKMDWNMDLPLGPKRVKAEVWKAEPEKNLTAYFIHQPDFYFRQGLYADSNGDFKDNAQRFIFLSKAAAHLARHLPWQPEVVHSHDWQTGLVPLLIQHQKLQESWFNVPRTVFTIHNLAYQGIFGGFDYALTNLPKDYFDPSGIEFNGDINCLKAGIAHADAVTTVSPRYAREITTPEQGCGLDDLLRRRQNALFGILNGVDYDEWKTTDNPLLPFPYSARAMSGKTKDKLELQKEFSLPVAADIPLFGTITRLADQKGLDIELAALQEMLSTKMQFVLLGSGAQYIEKGFRELAQRFPNQVGVRFGFDQGLSHRIEAGCDFYIMPSKFEPCGLNQMYSLRYGTVPIVRVTGGLDDTVIDMTEDAKNANGIKFQEYSARALAKAMRKALVLHDEKKLLQTYRRNGMKADFSWAKIVKQYLAVYKGG